MPSASMASREIVSARADGSIIRTDWAASRDDARRLAQALERLGVQARATASRTLAMNHDRHLVRLVRRGRAWAASSTRSTRGCSTISSIYIVNHAEDRVLLYDEAFAPLVERLKPQLDDRSNIMSASTSEFEDWLAAEDGDYRWDEGDERDPCMLCYTSGTTGQSQGRALRASLDRAPRHVDHRARHFRPFGALGDAAGRADVPRHQLGHSLRRRRWSGCKFVICADNEPERSAGCSTRRGSPIPPACRRCGSTCSSMSIAPAPPLASCSTIIVGGSSAPPAIIRWFRERGIRVNHLWGMTEMSPIGTVGAPPANWDTLSDEEQIAYHVAARAARCSASSCA